MGFIYKITSLTGRLYVGKTVHVGGRINTYKRNLIRNYRWKNSMIMNSLEKYGWDAHKFEIIEECSDSLLCEREIFWIKKLDTYCFENPRNMNMTRGGDRGGKPWMFDIGRREKQSKAFSGKGNPFYGKKHSKEYLDIKSKQVSEYNKKNGVKVPEWGTEKGREAVMKWVIAYGNDGNFINEFRSLTLAAKKLKINIGSVKDSLKWGSWVFGKYLFKYKTENYPTKIEVGKIKIKQEKREVLYLDNNYKVIKKYPSAAEAAIELKVAKTTINRAAMYNWLKPIMSGHIFIYKDLYKEAVKRVKKEGVKKARNQNIKSEYHYKWYRNKKQKQSAYCGGDKP